MKKPLIALALLGLIFSASPAVAQCSGVFSAGSVCGSVNGGAPGQVPNASIVGILPLPNGDIFLGNSSNKAAAVAPTSTGDCTFTLNNTGLFTYTCLKTGGVAFGSLATQSSVLTGQLPAPFTNGTATGNTSKFATSTGTLTNGDCVKIDVNGNFVDSLGVCGGSSTSFNFGGRLTLTSGTPITTTDVVGATVVFYAPLSGGAGATNTVPVWNGAAFVNVTITSSANDTVGQSVTLGSNWASGSGYDWFEGLNAGTPTLCSGPAWSNSGAGTSARGTGAGTTQLQMLNGIWTNAVSMTCRFNNTTTFTCAVNQCTYLGSTLMTGAGLTEDSQAKRYTYNQYNQSIRKMKVVEGTASWSYTLTTWRQANANTANQLSIFAGFPGTLLEARVDATGDTSAAGSFVAVGVGINVANADSSDTHQTTNCTNRCPVSATLKTYPGLGLTNIVWIEAAGIASGTNNYEGVQSGSGIIYVQSGITGTLLF
jgi:hypothetical protein